MSTDRPSQQHIARLTPLREVLSFLDSKAGPVVARTVNVDNALGRMLADDCVAPSALPPHAIALRDGFAVQSDETSDASSYAPAIRAGEPVFVNAGERLPDGCDAVALPDTVIVQGGQSQIVAPVAPAEGVLPAGADASASQLLCRAGARLEPRSFAILRAAGIARITIRQPRIRVVATNDNDAIITACADMLASLIAAEGGLVSHESSDNLQSAFGDASADAIIAVGGTGMGRNDGAVTALAHAGEVAFHGIALSPGETAAIGMIAGRPVLLFPGKIDATLACWLTLGRTLLARLTGASQEYMTNPATLSRKIASSIGMTDMVLVLRESEKAEPLASGYWPMHALARANGFVAVPPESEGYPAGASVTVSDLP